MGSKWEMICAVKFSIFFLIVSLPFLLLAVQTHEDIHQAIFKSFGINDSYIYMDWLAVSGYTYFDSLKCPEGSQCWTTQQAIEQTKPKSDREFMRVVLIGFLIILSWEVSTSLIRHRRDGLCYEKDKLNNREIDGY